MSFTAVSPEVFEVVNKTCFCAHLWGLKIVVNVAHMGRGNLSCGTASMECSVDALVEAFPD